MGFAEWIGLLLTIVGGLVAGTSAWPAKLIHRLQYEHWALVSSALGLLILPWVTTLLLCPHALSGYASLPADVWIKALLFSAAWGVANVLCTLCWLRIGVALAVGLLTGIGLPVGILIPMFFKGSGLFENAPDLGSPAGRIILVAIGVMLIGVLLAALAGRGRERTAPAAGGGFAVGLVMACLAGVLQVGLSFSFVYTQGPIIAAMKQRGADELGANMAVWAVCLIGGGLVNVLYPLSRLLRNRNWHLFDGGGREIGLASIMGVSFTAFVVLMGSGLRMLGPLGASVGFGVFQALQLSGAQGLGFLTGEWRHVEGRPRRQMYTAIALLLIAVIIIAYAGSLAPAARAADLEMAVPATDPSNTEINGSKQVVSEQRKMMATMQEQTRQWIQDALAEQPTRVNVRLIHQGWGPLHYARSINGEPLKIKGRPFVWGLGTHADGDIALEGAAMARIRGYVGVDENSASRGSRTSLARIEFWIEADGKELWRSPVMTLDTAPLAFDVDLGGSRKVNLKCRAVDGNLDLAHADWAEAVVVLAGGRTMQLGAPLTEPVLKPGIPLSFSYGGKASGTLLPSWRQSRAKRQLPDGVTLHTLNWTDPATGLECVMELKEYADFPAAEWVVHLRNTGKADTPILENILPLDLAGDVSPAVTLHRSRGSMCSKDDFAYSADVLERGRSLTMTPVEGRSSYAWLPFFNLVEQQTSDWWYDFRSGVGPAEPARGSIIAIGWTGCWSAAFDWTGSASLSVRAGVEKTHLTLHPGESIRTPSILVLNWQGKPLDGNNLLRQFILKHHTPQAGGKPVEGPICNGTWGGMKSDGHLERIKLCASERLPYDYYWIDAAWFGPADSRCAEGLTGDWSSHVGDWSINPAAHPKGLRPISDAAHQAGMKFLLWFEPERAIWGTPLTRQHPDWFLGEKKDGSNVILNLGNPEARTWITQFISGRIASDGVDCYRQDFNIDPLPTWRAADAPDRIGMTEIKYIEGLYAFWDGLLADHPNLVIDNCASGGRRLDLEMISRSIALWRSDVQCFPGFDMECSQSQTLGLSLWVPLSACGTEYCPGDTYRFRSSLSSGMVFHLFSDDAHPIDPKYPYEWHRKMMADFVRARPMFTGNFYPLTPFRQDKEAWAGFQCHRADTNQGLVLAFRREKCPFSAASVPLNELDPAARYEFEDADSGQRWIETGEKLLKDGLPLTMDKPRSAKLVFYKKL